MAVGWIILESLAGESLFEEKLTKNCILWILRTGAVAVALHLLSFDVRLA